MASPNRTIPWISDNFNYEFKGGLEPQEEQHLKLAPNMFGDWAVEETKNRNDLVMTIKVKNAQNAKGEEIISAFDDEDLKRLETLLEEKKKLLLNND